MRLRVTAGHMTPRNKRKPTIYEALCDKLGRVPTQNEIKQECHRILEEGLCERAEKGKLKHQRKR